MVKHSLPQTVECAEKHAEFMTENYHEVLEKLDELQPELKNHYRVFTEQVGSAVDKIVSNIYDIKILLYKYIKTNNEAYLAKVLQIIRETRVLTRKTRKLYQAVKEKLFDLLSDKLELFTQQSKDPIIIKIKATIIEIKYGRRNLYAIEEHLTDLQKHIVGIIKGQKKQSNSQP